MEAQNFRVSNLIKKTALGILPIGRGFVVIGFGLALLGCSTSAYFGVPNQRFESPVVAGETWKGALGIGYEKPTFIVTVKDITVTPPANSGTEVTKDPNGLESSALDKVSVDLRLGLFEKFEISNVGDLYHLKYQFLGSSRVANKSNEWVGAVTADYFSASREAVITAGINNYTYELDANGYGASVIVGFKDDKNAIYYLNLNYLDFEADTDITQGSTPYSYSDNGSQLGAALGLRYEQSPKGFYANIEWSYSKTDWANLKSKEWGTVGALMGVSW